MGKATLFMCFSEKWKAYSKFKTPYEMKIISWNFRGFTDSKILKPLNAILNTMGHGATILEYVTKLVIADEVWQNITSPDPFDIFILIEVKSGGSTKGRQASASCLTSIPMLVQSLNLASNRKGTFATHQYDYVRPMLVVGHNETAVIVYNTVALTANLLDIVGVHAARRGGTPNVRKPIDYCIDLSLCPDITNTANDLIFSGDFNTNPDEYYYNGHGVLREPFEALTNANIGYATNLPTPTLTSLKTSVVRADINNPQPSDYLANAYDNIFYKINGATIQRQNVLDVIANARDMSQPGYPLIYPRRVVMLRNNYWSVSDHLPIQLEYTLPAQGGGGSVMDIE